LGLKPTPYRVNAKPTFTYTGKALFQGGNESLRIEVNLDSIINISLPPTWEVCGGSPSPARGHPTQRAWPNNWLTLEGERNEKDT
jgi:hypothetical protein